MQMLYTVNNNANHLHRLINKTLKIYISGLTKKEEQTLRNYWLDKIEK